VQNIRPRYSYGSYQSFQPSNSKRFEDRSRVIHPAILEGPLEIFETCVTVAFHLFIPTEIWKEKSQGGPNRLKPSFEEIQPWVLNSLSRKELNEL